MLKTFVIEYCQVSPDYCVTKAEFYEAYCHCEQDHGRQPLHINEIGRQMKDLDFAEERTKNARSWTGIRLIDIDLTSTSDIEQTLSIPTIYRNSSTREEEFNERLRQEMAGVCTFQKF